MKKIFQRNSRNAAKTPEQDPINHPESKFNPIYFHNLEILSAELDSSAKGVAVYKQIIDGKRCLATPLNLYVERDTGRILTTTSSEREKRERAYSIGSFFVASSLPNVVLPIDDTQSDKPVFGDIAKVPIWYQSAWPNLDKSAQIYEDKLVTDRPETWSRNNQVVLNEDDPSCALALLLPDPIERGVFLKSLDKYNSVAEPSYVDA